MINNRKTERRYHEKSQKWNHTDDTLNNHGDQKPHTLEYLQGGHTVHGQTKDHEPKVFIHIVNFLGINDNLDVSKQLHPIEYIKEVMSSFNNHLNQFNTKNEDGYATLSIIESFFIKTVAYF